MVEQTSASEESSLEKVATHFHELGNAFDEEEPTIMVGNKTVTVHPPARIAYEIDVIESSSIWGGETETISLELSWQPEEKDGDN